MTNYRKEYFKEIADAITQAGFIVYVAENGEYGFYTDEKGERVVSIGTEYGMVKFSGNYEGTRENGTGWGMGDLPKEFKYDHETLNRMLYATTWVRFTDSKGPKYTTLKRHLETYGPSSKYQIYRSV